MYATVCLLYISSVNLYVQDLLQTDFVLFGVVCVSVCLCACVCLCAFNGKALEAVVNTVPCKLKYLENVRFSLSLSLTVL